MLFLHFSWIKYYQNPIINFMRWGLLCASLLNACSYAQNIANSPDEITRFKSNDEKKMREQEKKVWVQKMMRRLSIFIRDPNKQKEILKYTYQEALRHQLPPELILAVMHTESSFNRFAVSSAGAQGIMQIMPFWKKEIGHPEDNLTNLLTNIQYGCQILKRYLKKEKGNLTRALARYNGSLGKYWYPKRIYSNFKKYWLYSSLD